MQDLQDYNYTNFYELYRKIEDSKLKKLIQSLIKKKCRVSAETVRNWISLETIPIYQSNRVTKVVILISAHLNINGNDISETKLFPKYALDIESYA